MENLQNRLREKQIQKRRKRAPKIYKNQSDLGLDFLDTVLVRQQLWVENWLDGYQYYMLLKNQHRLDQKKYPILGSHPTWIYEKPLNGHLYFLKDIDLEKDGPFKLGFPRTTSVNKKSWKWKRNNFPTKLPKNDPKIVYICATTEGVEYDEEGTPHEKRFRMHIAKLIDLYNREQEGRNESEGLVVCQMLEIEFGKTKEGKKYIPKPISQLRKRHSPNKQVSTQIKAIPATITLQGEDDNGSLIAEESSNMEIEEEADLAGTSMYQLDGSISQQQVYEKEQDKAGKLNESDQMIIEENGFNTSFYNSPVINYHHHHLPNQNCVNNIKQTNELIPTFGSSEKFASVSDQKLKQDFLDNSHSSDDPRNLLQYSSSEQYGYQNNYSQLSPKNPLKHHLFSLGNSSNSHQKMQQNYSSFQKMQWNKHYNSISNSKLLKFRQKRNGNSYSHSDRFSSQNKSSQKNTDSNKTSPIVKRKLFHDSKNYEDRHKVLSSSSAHSSKNSSYSKRHFKRKPANPQKIFSYFAEEQNQQSNNNSYLQKEFNSNIFECQDLTNYSNCNHHYPHFNTNNYRYQMVNNEDPLLPYQKDSFEINQVSSTSKEQAYSQFEDLISIKDCMETENKKGKQLNFECNRDYYFYQSSSSQKMRNLKQEKNQHSQSIILDPTTDDDEVIVVEKNNYQQKQLPSTSEKIIIQIQPVVFHQSKTNQNEYVAYFF